MLLSSQKARELVCRVQLVSARGDSPAAQTGTFEILSQHPSVGVRERLRAREGSLTGGPGRPVIPPRLKRFGGVDIGRLGIVV